MPKKIEFVTNSETNRQLAMQAMVAAVDDSECYKVTIERITPDKVRTVLQNRALHKGMNNIVKICNARNISAADFFSRIQRSHIFEVSPEAVKSVVRVICESLYGKGTTTKIPPGGMTDVWDILSCACSERLGIDIGDFPSEESMMRDQFIKSEYEQYREAK